MGNYAFQGCTGLTSFTIPENVASVGDGVFNNCPDLNTLYYNAIQCTIGTEVWPFLSTVHIGAQVKSISGTHDGEETFDGSIKEVHITDIAAWCGIEFGDSVNNPLYQDSARLYLNGEEIKHHVVIPESATYFGSYALYGIDFEYVRMLGHTPPTYNSTSFSFTNSEKGTLFVPFGSKDDYATAGWDDTFVIYEGDLLTLHVSTPGTLLDEVVETGSQPSHVLGLTLSGTLDDADYETMKGMWQLCFLDLADTDSKSLPQGIFSSRPLKAVSLPPSMTTLGASAFENCERLHTINLERITGIGMEAFSGCTALEDSISLPDIRNIGGDAFFNSSLRSVVLGRNAQSVAYDAFSGCRLESITCKSETPPSVSRTFSNIIDKGNCVLYVPQPALADYLRATAWKDFYHMEGVDFGPAYTLTVQSADETQGTTTGGGVYEEGEEITITATALPGYHFVQWSDGNTQNPRTITVTEDKSFYATFEKDVNFFQLTFKCGTGGNVRYAGNTYTNGSVTVSDAEPIRVQVVPQTGYEIASVALDVELLQPDSDGWVSFLVTTDCTLEVKFEAIHYMIDVQCDTEKGQVSGGGEYVYGTQATLMATPYSGYHFVQWSDGNTDNPRTITVTEDKSFYATFESEVNALSTTSIEGLAIYPNPATTHVNIQTEGGIKRVLLHSLASTLLMDEDGHGEATYRLDITRLPQGTYLLTVETPAGIRTERIVKE